MGPLDGITCVEMGGGGPGPFAAMLLADLGAEVIRVDRPISADPSAAESRSLLVNGRGRRTIAVDLKKPGGAEVVLRLVERADGFLDVFRPGVAERLGIGPEECFRRNPRLVYVRVTGWGQAGPYAQAPGHDLNYIGVTGVLDAIGSADQLPPIPLNVVGDYGGGGMIAAVGMLAAIIEARRSGKGQVVDASILDGVALLSTLFHGQRATGEWIDDRASNSLNGAAHFYNVYETSDSRALTVAAGEQAFYEALLEELGLPLADHPQYGTERWPEMREKFAAIIKEKPYEYWRLLVGDPRQCIAPVWSFAEAPADPHNAARGTYVEVDGIVQPQAAPRFARTPGSVGGIARPGEHSRAVLEDWGFSAGEIAEMERKGTVRQRPCPGADTTVPADTTTDEFSLLEADARDAGVAWDGRPTVGRVSAMLASGREVSGISWGSGKPGMIFLHGGAQNAHTWDGTALALRRPVLALDLPGHGHSDWRPDEQYQVRVLAADVAEVVGALTIPPVVLVGMSMGGLVGLDLAATRPDLVRALALIDITPDHKTTTDTASDFFRKKSFSSFDELVDHAAALSGRTDEQARRTIMHNARERPDGRWEWRHHFGEGIVPRGTYESMWGQLAEFPGRVMLVRGGRSRIVTDDQAARFSACRPDAILDVVPGAGHSVQRTHPRELAALLLRFAAGQR